jgi:hypothetical protein
MSKAAETNHSFLCSIACRIRPVWYTRSFSTSTKVCFSAWASVRYYECRSTRGGCNLLRARSQHFVRARCETSHNSNKGID